MTIQTRIEFKEYLGLMYRLTYRKPLIIIWTILGGLLLLIAFLGIVASLLSGQGSISKDFTTLIITGFIMVGFYPFIVYQQAKRNYFTDARIKELITYQIQNDALIINGESFSSTLSWDKMWKAVELKDWFLLYQNQLVANLIPKRALDDQQLDSIRSIINAQPNVKKKLKK